MKRQNMNGFICILLLSVFLVSCGNKGDLFLIADPISQQDMQQLQQSLNTDDIPTGDAVDVDDQDVYKKPLKDSDDTSGASPVDK
ncbi:hypothetical protein [Granulosicoccus antarcticus]|nr:hypothetical protein [Granulosicoccus antarcticus]